MLCISKCQTECGHVQSSMPHSYTCRNGSNVTYGTISNRSLQLAINGTKQYLLISICFDVTYNLIPNLKSTSTLCYSPLANAEELRSRQSPNCVFLPYQTRVAILPWFPYDTYIHDTLFFLYQRVFCFPLFFSPPLFRTHSTHPHHPLQPPHTRYQIPTVCFALFAIIPSVSQLFAISPLMLLPLSPCRLLSTSPPDTPLHCPQFLHVYRPLHLFLSHGPHHKPFFYPSLLLRVISESLHSFFPSSHFFLPSSSPTSSAFNQISPSLPYFPSNYYISSP